MDSTGARSDGCSPTKSSGSNAAFLAVKKGLTRAFDCANEDDDDAEEAVEEEAPGANDEVEEVEEEEVPCSGARRFVRRRGGDRSQDRPSNK